MESIGLTQKTGGKMCLLFEFIRKIIIFIKGSCEKVHVHVCFSLHEYNNPRRKCLSTEESIGLITWYFSVGLTQ